LAEDRQPRNGAQLGSLEGAPLRRAPAADTLQLHHAL
jgi:hypothetical protein